jgi:hypothetical protein
VSSSARECGIRVDEGVACYKAGHVAEAGLFSLFFTGIFYILTSMVRCVVFGSLLGLFWVSFGSLLGLFWVSFGSLLGSLLGSLFWGMGM